MKTKVYNLLVSWVEYPTDGTSVWIDNVLLGTYGSREKALEMWEDYKDNWTDLDNFQWWIQEVIV